MPLKMQVNPWTVRCSLELGGAPNVLQAHPYEHVMWLHLGATEVFFALPRAEQSALRLETSVLHGQGKPLEGLWATQHPSESDQIDV